MVAIVGLKYPPESGVPVPYILSPVEFMDQPAVMPEDKLPCVGVLHQAITKVGGRLVFVGPAPLVSPVVEYVAIAVLMVQYRVT